MSWPSKEDLDDLLENARTSDGLLVSSETLIYLIENLRRVNGEIARQADQMDKLEDDLLRANQRAKKWKRKYTALENKSHEARQDPTE